MSGELFTRNLLIVIIQVRNRWH